MNWHPLVLAVWLADMLAWLVYLGAGLRLLPILAQWQPGRMDARQLGRERALELIVYQGRWTMALQAVAAVLVVIGVSSVWPACITGAMCGTGVLQAMGPAGTQTLFFRGSALLIFYCWQVAERLNRSRPESFLAMPQARLLLLAAPCMALGTWSFAQAVTAAAGNGTVSCCAALYAGTLGGASSAGLMPGPAAARTLSGLLGGLMIFWGWLQWRRPRLALSRWALMGAAVAVAWAFTALLLLKTSVAPYVYEVLWHPCPWCFFLWEHGGVGFAYFGLLAWIIAESAAGLTAAAVARRYVLLGIPASRRMQAAGSRIMTATALFLTLAVLPALLWRLRFGGWMN